MLEQALIDYCSPTLARIKPASLFTQICTDPACLARQVESMDARLREKGLALTALCRKGDRTLLYLYRPGEMARRLEDERTQAFLRECGYARFDLEAALSTLRARLAAREDFPHEIGVFLGYPLTDVIAFIENDGQNCLCSGCWKVYSDECAARRTFERYRRCKRLYAQRFREGFSLSRLAVAGA